MITMSCRVVHSPRVGGLGHVDAMDTHLVCNVTKRLDALLVWLLITHLQSGENFYWQRALKTRVKIWSSYAQTSIKDRETYCRGGEPCILIAGLESAGKIGVWLEVASLKLTVAFQGAAQLSQQGQLEQKGSSGRVQIQWLVHVRMRNPSPTSRSLHNSSAL